MCEEKSNLNCNDKIGNELLLQLHQQFAENQHKHNDRLLSTLLGLLVIFGIYGACFGISTGLVVIEGYEISPIFTYFIVIGVFIILYVLLHITIQNGYQYRRDQHLIDKIRINKLNENYNYFFENYKSNEGKNCLNWFPSYLTPKVILFILFYLLIFISSTFITPCFIDICYCNLLLITYVVQIIFGIVLFIAIVAYWVYQYCKFKKLFTNEKNQSTK